MNITHAHSIDMCKDLFLKKIIYIKEIGKLALVYLTSSLTFEILLRKELGGDPNWINITMEALRGLWETLTGLGKSWTKMGGFWERLCLKTNWVSYGKDSFILGVKQVGEWRISHLFPHPIPKVSFIVRHTAHNSVVGHVRPIAGL